MQHSIAAKYAARPAARFVCAPSRASERRLGLRSTASFRAIPPRATVLRRPELPSLLRLRASWRSLQPARPRRAVSGHLRPAVSMRWSRPSGPVREGRSSAASAPWLA
ncbi:MAG: hypothetical protein ACXWWR_03375 [Candidatus Limnocylindrales bacterium]